MTTDGCDCGCDCGCCSPFKSASGRRLRRIGWDDEPFTMSDGRVYAPPMCPTCRKPDWRSGTVNVTITAQLPDGPLTYKVCPDLFHRANREKAARV